MYMVNYRMWIKNKKIFSLSLSLLLSSWTEAGAYQQGSVTKILGKDMGGNIIAGNPSGTQQVSTTVTMNVLGFLLQALEAFAAPANTIDGVTYNEYYSFGKRVFAPSVQISQNQNSQIDISFGLAPSEVRVAVMRYPVGPITLEVDAGARFWANLKTQFTPTFMLPDLSLSSLNIQLQTNAMGAGFVEGYASMLVLRGGIGGQLDLVDATAYINGFYFFDGKSNPTYSVSAMVQFLKGRVYAFVDYFNLFGGKFRRLWDKDLYNRAGTCYATGTLTCPAS